MMANPTRLWSVDVPLSTKVAGRTLAEWVDVLHRYNCTQRKWEYKPLQSGAFGFEILAVSVLALSGAAPQTDREALGALVHAAWCAAYLYWRNNPPGPPYRLPYVALGDKQRDECAMLSFADLPTNERTKDLIVVDGFMAARFPSADHLDAV